MNATLEPTMIVRPPAGRPRQWLNMRLHAATLLARLPEADGRRGTLRLLVSVLDSCERARAAGREPVRAALWDTCELLACRMAGRWS